jgi:hypothetical protein
MLTLIKSHFFIGTMLALVGICCLYNSWRIFYHDATTWFYPEGPDNLRQILKEIREFWKNFHNPPPGKEAYDILMPQQDYVARWNENKGKINSGIILGILFLGIGLLIIIF